MIDIHAHILPGIDDGASDIYDTLKMAQMAADSGCTTVVATPHCNLPGAYDNYFGKKYIELFERVSGMIAREQIPIRLLPGAEVFATWDLPELLTEKKIMSLNGSRYVLIEFRFDEDPEFADSVLERVAEVRAKPVVAHVERYDFVKDNPMIVSRWRKKGYQIQVNKGSFMGRYGKESRRLAYEFLERSLITAIASDAHGYARRTPYMADVRRQLSEEYPREYLEELFVENPRRICENRPVISRQPGSFMEER